MAREISNSDDYIDSRDIIARIEELTEQQDDSQRAVDEAQEAHTEAVEEEHGPDCAQRQHSAAECTCGKAEKVSEAKKVLDSAEEVLTGASEEAQELKLLEELQNDAEGYAPDWRHGTTLIRDDCFEAYAQEFAADMHGSAVHDAAWPFNCIDWDRAVDELKQDYTCVDFDGVEYWFR